MDVLTLGLRGKQGFYIFQRYKQPQDRLPPNKVASPGQPPAEGGQEDQVTRLDSAVSHRLIQGYGDGGGGDVPVLFDVHIDLIHRDVQLFGHPLQDAKVRLMGDNHLDIIQGEVVVGECLLACLGEAPHRDLEGSIALDHSQGMKLLINALM